MYTHFRRVVRNCGFQSEVAFCVNCLQLAFPDLEPDLTILEWPRAHCNVLVVLPGPGLVISGGASSAA
eukprot:SAG22_NODE_1768_length_3615_cov_6.235495_5_plen_68_part_00